MAQARQHQALVVLYPRKLTLVIAGWLSVKEYDWFDQCAIVQCLDEKICVMQSLCLDVLPQIHLIDDWVESLIAASDNLTHRGEYEIVSDKHLELGLVFCVGDVLQNLCDEVIAAVRRPDLWGKAGWVVRQLAERIQFLST
jgi:hypothetical protein